MDSPVVLMLFNRPDTAARVFEAIRLARPSKLLVISDGARADRAGEADQVAASRELLRHVDWPCQVLENYSDKNLGCGKRISSGLTWAFQNVDRAIILEDDCVPSQSFFRFCDAALDRYENNPSVMHIGGVNFQPCRRSEFSVYFSKYPHCWGWATWRRAWQHYDFDMQQYPASIANGSLRKRCMDRTEYVYWRHIFKRVRRGAINTWDYQWLFACLMEKGVSVLPECNLVSNIGFRADATHTNEESAHACMPRHEIDNITFPPDIRVNQMADNFTFRSVFKGPQCVAQRKWYRRAPRRIFRYASVACRLFSR